MLKTSFIKISIQGLENMPEYPYNPAIIISNHTSALDIPILEAITGNYPHVWMSKIEYKQVPVMGFLLKRMHVLVDRNAGKKALQDLLAMHNMLKGNARHALIFPEGTRHDDGKIHEFHQGFALLAQKLKRPVIPVIISGLHSVLPKKSFSIDSSNRIVTIKIGARIEYNEAKSIEDFVASVQHYFEKEQEPLGA